MTGEPYGEIARIAKLMAEAVVDEPDRVRVKESQSGNTVIVELSVAPGDVGKVVGKKGVHADAMRTLLTAIGGKHGRKTQLDIIEPRSRRSSSRRRRLRR